MTFNLSTKLVLNHLKPNSEQNYLEKELYQLIKTDENIFRFMQDSALDGLWFWDLDNPDNEWMNPKFWTTLGYDPHEMPHSSSAWQNIIHEDDLKLAMLNFTKHCQDPSHPYDLVVRYRHKLGRTVWIQCRGLLIRDQKNKPVRMLGAHTDVTRLKETELKLKKEVQKYKHIISDANIGVWEWNIQSGETIVNGQWAKVHGYDKLELEDTSMGSWLKNLHPDDLEKANDELQIHCAGDTSHFDCELRVKNKNDDWIWVHNKGKIVSWTDTGLPEWMIGSTKGITDTKKELKVHKAFIEQAPTAIAMFDTDMCYIACSEKWIIDYNIQEEHIQGKSHYEIFPEIGEDWRQDHKDCLNGKVLKSDEDSFVRDDGSVQWLSWELRPWFTADNSIGGIIMYTADITSIKETERKLKISEETFRGNFENAAIGMAILCLDDKYLEVNPSICKTFGYTSEELFNMSFHDVIHVEDKDIGTEITTELLDGAKSYYTIETRFMHKDGSVVYTVLSKSLVRDSHGIPLHFLIQINNITPRILARKKMEAAFTKMEGLFEASNQVGIIATNTKGLITAFNKGAEHLLGYTKEEMILKQSPAIIHNEKELIKRGKQLSMLLDKKIEGFDVFVAMAKQEIDHTQEWQYIRKDGSCFPVQLTVTPIKEDGEVTGYLGVATDISKIKGVEKEIKSLLQVTKNQNDRLLNFAHIVSHNLKSHSGNFSMLLSLFIQDHQEFEDNEMIKLFRNASDNLSETIEHLNEVVLMNMSINKETVSLNLFDSIANVLHGLSGIAKESSVNIENLVESNTTVLGVPAYLDSILLNFLSNGIKYRSEERDSTIILSAYIKNKYLVLSIADNGLGIDLDENGNKLFGMYKTFHHNEDARGIGLFITKNQVEAIGGKIKVTSQVGVGTTFEIFFKR